MANPINEWFTAKSDFPSWSTDLAERTLFRHHPDPFLPERILQSLVIIQQLFGHIAPQMQEWLSRKSRVHIADIRALMSFYLFLEQGKPHQYHLRFANNIIEQQAGVNDLLSRVQEKLCGCECKIETTSCIGMSDHPVSLLVNGFPVTRLTADNVDEFCQLIRQRIPLQDWPGSWFAVNNLIRHKGPLTAYPYQLGKAITLAKSLSREQIIQLIGDAGLRGLGGAGFPTAFKWHWCEQQNDPIKFIACNADEGEPGTFKDRYYLSQQANQMIEGMIIAALAVGAVKGFIYLRGEYLYLYQQIEEALQRWRDQGHLGVDFDIELHLGAGAYICGEESAMIESLAGRRGIPTPKPPFPGEKGLFDKPTVVNNVETFICATYILQQGPSAFKAVGTEKSPGSRLHSVSGDCQQPGLYELPQGTPVRELLALCGAQDTLCVQAGGPSGTLLLPHQFDTPLDFDNPGRGGSVMVFNRSRSALDITRNFTRFFRHESCGFCTPCRAGTVAMCNLLDRYEHKPAMQEQSKSEMIELAHLMQQTSHCGLGKTAGLPILNFFHQAEHHE